jgi:hypothetical protein
MKRYVITAHNPTWFVGHAEQLNEATDEWVVLPNSDWVFSRHIGCGHKLPKLRVGRFLLPPGMCVGEFSKTKSFGFS